MQYIFFTECSAKFSQKGAEFILEDFDVLYSFLIHFKSLDHDISVRGLDLMMKGENICLYS